MFEEKSGDWLIKALVVLIILGVLIIIGLTIGIIVFNSVGYHGPSNSDMEKIFCPWAGGRLLRS